MSYVCRCGRPEPHFKVKMAGCEPVPAPAPVSRPARTEPDGETETLAEVAALIRAYLTDETDVTGPSLHATVLTHQLTDVLAARDAESQAKALAPIRALADEMTERVNLRRAEAPAIGPDDRQPWVHFTAGFAEARDWLAAALREAATPQEQP